MSDIYLSVIIPFYNERENLADLHKEIVSVLKEISKTKEIIYVNDGSSDRSQEILEEVVKKIKYPHITVKIISFRRNFGQTAAISAGIKKAKGELISFLDADLQNDPHDIPRFIEKLEEGYDAVFGWRKERKDATLRSFLSRVANNLINIVFSYPYNDVGCSSRIVRAEFVKGLNLYGELHRILPVLIYLNGANIAEIVVTHRYRQKGRSKYGFERIVKTMIDIITVKFLSSYSTRPAYVFSTFGIGSIIISMLTLAGSLYKKLFLGVFIHKDPLFMIAIFFGLLGVQFFMLGLIAELQIRTYFESQNKSIYEIKNEKEF